MFDSGNPVFDATVAMCTGATTDPVEIEEVHAKLLELAAKEPGGFYQNGSRVYFDPPEEKPAAK